MDRAQVRAAELTPLDTSAQCTGDHRSWERSGPPEGAAALIPHRLHTDGDEFLLEGHLDTEAAPGELTRLAPNAEIAPADPQHRSLPAPAATEGSSGTVPPLIGLARVESSLERTPSTVATRMRIGACDGGRMPDGPYVMALDGEGFEPTDGAPSDPSWQTSSPVLIDVVDGQLQPVTGAVTAPAGEIPAETSLLACGAIPEGARAEPGLQVRAEDHRTSVPATGTDGQAVGVDATLRIVPERPGTRALLEGIVITLPGTGQIVAGARSAETVGLQWLGADGISTTTTAWTSTDTCSHRPLEAGTYRAYAFVLTVNGDGSSAVVLSNPWDVEVTATAQ